MAATVSKHHLNIFISHLRRQAINQRRLFSHLGIEQYLSDAVDRNERMEVNALLDLMLEAQHFLDKPLLAMEAGSMVHPADYGVLGLLLTSCKNVAESIRMAERHQGLVRDHFRQEQTYGQDSLISRIDTVDYDPEYIRPFVEQELTAIIAMAHFVTGRLYPQTPLELRFQHQAADSEAEYQRIAGGHVSFEHPHSELEINKLILQTPVYGHNEVVKRALLGEVHRLEDTLDIKSDFAQSVVAYLHENLFNTMPSLRDCAEHFCISISTLKRRLSDAGLSYQDLCNQVRLAAAKNMLNNQEVDIGEIWSLLGFSHQAAFSRAFKSWTGMTPTQYRRSSAQ